MIFITRRAEFSAAHTLANPRWSQEENDRIYGLCAHPKGHGHNYVIEVTLAGDPNPETGMLIDLKKVKRVMQDEILSKVDHRNLNEDPDFLAGLVPTAENVAIGCYQVLEKALPPGLLYRVRIYESERNFADYYGPKGPQAVLDSQVDS